MNRLKYLCLIVISALILTLTACGADQTATQPSVEATEASTGEATDEASTSTEEATGEAEGSSPDPVTIEIKLFLFPDVVEVPVGTTVTWVNMDNIRHSVTNGTPDAQGSEFDSGFFVQGESFSYTFTEVGDYPYFCMRHNHMQGIIRVVAND